MVRPQGWLTEQNSVEAVNYSGSQQNDSASALSFPNLFANMYAKGGLFNIVPQTPAILAAKIETGFAHISLKGFGREHWKL